MGIAVRDICKRPQVAAERQYQVNKVIITGMKARVAYLEWFSRRRIHEMLMGLVRRLHIYRE